MLEHTHAIIIIKNDKGEYLQYFDDRWDSYLFPNCKLTDDNHKCIITNYLLQQLNVECATEDINYVMDKVHEKYSVSANKVKQYHHFFYTIEKGCLSNERLSRSFTINNINCAWLSLEELENNERIQKVNSDIIEFIKDLQ